MGYKASGHEAAAFLLVLHVGGGGGPLGRGGQRGRLRQDVGRLGHDARAGRAVLQENVKASLGGTQEILQ